MMILRKTSSLFFTMFIVCTMTATTAYAAGGGGGGTGGGFSSPSGPSYDPVEEYQKGIDKLKEGDDAGAEKAFRKVLKVASKDANSNYLLGVSLVRQEKFKKARRPLEKAVKYDENNVLARGYLAHVYKLTKKESKADEHIEKIESLKTACGECESATTIQQALDIATQSAGDEAVSGLMLPEQDAYALYQVAVANINRGEYDAALETLLESARLAGPHPDILTYQGFANRKLGNFEQAYAFYNTALKIDDRHRGANEYLGEFYVENNQLDLAKQQLDKLKDICTFGCEEVEELQRWIDGAGF